MKKVFLSGAFYSPLKKFNFLLLYYESVIKFQEFTFAISSNIELVLRRVDFVYFLLSVFPIFIEFVSKIIERF
jgi:hypothetical protein